MVCMLVQWREEATETLFRKYLDEEVQKVAAEVKSGELTLCVPDESKAVTKLLEDPYFTDYKAIIRARNERRKKLKAESA
eukprot:SAG31_NODE_2895_length_4940_cov_4.688494_2_plen_80_part_00